MTRTGYKSAARVAAGRRNRQLRGELSDTGRARLREAALRNKPWLHSTGPTTPEGKAAVANNGRKHTKSQLSARQRRAIIAKAYGMIAQARQFRAAVFAD